MHVKYVHAGNFTFINRPLLHIGIRAITIAGIAIHRFKPIGNAPERYHLIIGVFRYAQPGFIISILPFLPVI